MNPLRIPACLFLIFVAAPSLSADMVFEPVPYDLNGVVFQGTLVYDEEAVEEAREDGETLTGVLMVPNWMGPGEAANRKAAKIAADEYILFVADVYGVDVRPSNSREASQAAGELRGGDRQVLRDRAAHALAIFREQGSRLPLEADRMAAIGFCFGGGTVLELARAGSDIPAVVSFHGNLDSPRPASPGELTASVLVLHGADDPYVPPAQVETFKSEMKSAGVDDWQLVEFGGAVHSFTDPSADSEGARYHERSAERAFEYMEELLEELFEEDDD